MDKDVAALLDQTSVVLQEVSAALARLNPAKMTDEMAVAFDEIGNALKKRKPMDLAPLIAALREMKPEINITVTPAPVQFLPAPDVTYDVEVISPKLMRIRKFTSKD